MGTINKQQLIKALGHIVVLTGGQSAEREISLLGGEAVVKGLSNLGATVSSLDCDSDLLANLQQLRPDFVFNMLHGRGGEDGVVQGLLEVMELPYTGSNVLASALSMDKVKTKLIWQQLGLSTAAFVVLDEASDWAQIIAQFGSVVVKPVQEGSSIGMAIVDTAVDLKAAFQAAQQYSCAVMAEAYVEGREFTIAVLGDRVLPTIQLRTERQFYDYDAKYVDNDTQYICPAELSESRQQELNSLALTAFKALSCCGWGRVDVMQDRDGVFYLLEVNTIPGMTGHSLVPMAAKQAGLEFEDLLVEIIAASGNGQNPMRQTMAKVTE